MQSERQLNHLDKVSSEMVPDGGKLLHPCYLQERLEAAFYSVSTDTR